MRIWSLHPKYLDSKGLVALWRESLLAKHVLSGLTKGYKNHPQLNRFKQTEFPLERINQYLTIIFEVSVIKGFKFNKDKIDFEFRPDSLTVTNGQLEYEKKHLLKKLYTRDKLQYLRLSKITCIESHPMFKVVDGKIENWEIVN
jgi:hypothetical protein